MIPQCGVVALCGTPYMKAAQDLQGGASIRQQYCAVILQYHNGLIHGHTVQERF